MIEVKTRLTRGSLEDAFSKCSKIRRMALAEGGTGNKGYLRQKEPKPKTAVEYETIVSRLPPRFLVFAYNGWKSAKTLEQNFKLETQKTKGVHVHGVCTLHEGGSFHIKHVAYKSGKAHFSAVAKNGFYDFVTTLPQLLISMLPVDRNRYGFDLVDVGRYRLGTRHEVQETG